MDEFRSPEQQQEPMEPESAHSRRQWKACCLAPTLAVIILIILSVAAGLFSPDARSPEEIREDQRILDEENNETREAFVVFGQEYFAIADRADQVSERAFSDLERYMQGSDSIENMRSSFREATDANRKAASEFLEIEIPANILAREKARQSADTMSRAYEARADACEILVRWNGDINDQRTAESYSRKVNEVNSLTIEGLQYLGQAADENGLTQDDIERFIPAAIFINGKFMSDGLPWRKDVIER